MLIEVMLGKQVDRKSTDLIENWSWRFTVPRNLSLSHVNLIREPPRSGISR